MVKKRTGDPWMAAAEYGRRLPAFSANLLVTDVFRAVAFYEIVLTAKTHYSDPDFAALRVGEAEFMLHADHTYEIHPWVGPLAAGARRGLGIELRVFGVNPDVVEQRARAAHAVIVQPATTKGHGWREVMVADPDGYIWAVGVSTPKAADS